MINIIRTGLDASNKEISTISHNLANGSTVGFKKSSAGFTDIYSQQVELRDNIDVGQGTRFVSAQRNHPQRTIIQTNGEIHLAKNGGSRSFKMIFRETISTIFSSSSASFVYKSHLLYSIFLVVQPFYLHRKSVKNTT